MTQVICVANQKGGTGKTTTSVNLSAALAIKKKKVLLVDCDPQGNATTGLGLDKSSMEASLYHSLIGERDLDQVVMETGIRHLHVLPSKVELTGFDVEMVSHPERETLLRKLLDPVRDRYRYIIIDCPPSLSLLTVNAMSAADAMLIPLQSEFYALEGLSQLLETVKQIKAGLNPGLKMAGILLTMFDKRTNLSNQVAEDAAHYFKDLMFQTQIPRNIKLGEAPSFGESIFTYAAASAGAKSYMALAREVMKL